MEKTAEEKRTDTIARGMRNKANHDLHISLIKKHIEFDIGDLKKASIEYFLENGRPTGGFLLALIEYAEEYSQQREQQEAIMFGEFILSGNFKHFNITELYNSPEFKLFKQEGR